MSFIQAIKNGFIGYVDFRGTATRREYLGWLLFHLLGSILIFAGYALIAAPLVMQTQNYDDPAALQDLANLSSGLTTVGWIRAVWELALLVPTFAVTARRLHDVNRSAKILYGWLPIIMLFLTGRVLDNQVLVSYLLAAVFGIFVLVWCLSSGKSEE